MKHMKRMMQGACIAVAAGGLCIASAHGQQLQDGDVLARAALGQPLVRALVTPRTETTLSSRLSAQVLRMAVREGRRFKIGDELVAFDCVVENANLKRAKANHQQALKTLDVRVGLKHLSAVSELDLAIAKADVEKTKAELAIADADVDGCVISAPFNGRVVERLAQAYEHVTPGQPLLNILDDTAMRLEILAPAQLAVRLSIGTTLSVVIDETGKTYRAQVQALGAKVDPSSQTLQVYADVDEIDVDLLVGMSGTVRFGHRE